MNIKRIERLISIDRPKNYKIMKERMQKFINENQVHICFVDFELIKPLIRYCMEQVNKHGINKYPYSNYANTHQYKMSFRINKESKKKITAPRSKMIPSD